jgi:probable HAF family extracellular repeat protein
MPYSALAFRCRTLLWMAVLVLSSVAHSQTQASCTFSFFSPSGWHPLGINDWGTVVGGGTNGGGFVLIGASLIFVPYVSEFVDRDHDGFSVGFTGPEGWYLRERMGYVPIQQLTLGNLAPVDHLTPGNLNEFTVRRRNKWGSSVGTYLDSQSRAHGFKRWNGGGFDTLDYPSSSRTDAVGINDLGAVVGSYTDAVGKQHGFIYSGRQWATLDYPKATATDLVGLANGGTIVGNGQVNGTAVAFLYSNGAFKTISVPNFPLNSTIVLGTSPRIGLILGTYPNGAFKATCN